MAVGQDIAWSPVANRRPLRRTSAPGDSRTDSTTCSDVSAPSESSYGVTDGEAPLLGTVIGDVAGDQDEVDVGHVGHAGQQAVQGRRGVDDVIVVTVRADVRV